MKHIWKLMGLLILAAGAVALGVSQFMSRDDRVHTTDVAAGALSVVANAADRVTTDNTAYTITVATRVGQGRLENRDQQVAVLAAIGVRGGDGLAEVCSSMPRVRDSINMLVTDRVAPRLRTGRAVRADELSADGQLVMATLNGLMQSGAVTDVRLVLKPARDAQESGCFDRDSASNHGKDHVQRASE